MAEETRFLSARGLTAVLSAALLAVSACAGDQPQEPAASEGQPVEEDPLADFYEQSFAWEECEDLDDDELRCGTVTVPLDHDEPEGETIEIALAARGEAEASPLLVNPGGPGGSGVDLVAQELPSFATEELLSSFNIVGFDPRGVHRSEGIRCLTEREHDQPQQLDPDAEGPKDLSESEVFELAVQRAENLAERCERRNGEILSNVDTFSAARDLDIVRAALDQDELDYLGFSYGTKLGLAYAEEFPEHVGRFVLDAMLDVSADRDEISLGQAEGLQDALYRFAQWCLQDRCPVSGEPQDVMEAVADLFDDVAENPRTGDDARQITDVTLVDGFVAAMYYPDGRPMLRDALETALTADDFTAFQYWNDLQSGRNPDGSYDWIDTEAFLTIMCSDFPTAGSPDQVEAEAEELEAASPIFGPYLGSAQLICEALPRSGDVEPWQPREDLPEMMFIGTTGDPITPVEDAENMHDMVPASSLLIYEGEGHVAYRRGADCVTDAVDGFLINGELFEGRQQC